MREWVKVALGVLAITIGASAPTLILEAVFFRSIYKTEQPLYQNIKGSEQERSGSQSHNQASASSAPSAEAANAQAARGHPAAGANQSERNNSSSEPSWVPIVQGLSAIAGLVIAAVIGGINFAQWTVYNSQAKIMMRQLAIARTSARAAQTSAETAQQALVSTQRAFVFLQSFEVRVIAGEVRVMPRWENSGVTPANPFRNYVSWRTFRGAPAADFEFPDLDPAGNPIAGKGQGETFFIGPKATMYAENVRIPIEIMEQARAGHLRIFIWGWGEYNDMFSGTKIHRSEFCREMVITDTAREDENLTSVAAQFRVYGKYNSAD